MDVLGPVWDFALAVPWFKIIAVSFMAYVALKLDNMGEWLIAIAVELREINKREDMRG